MRLEYLDGCIEKVVISESRAERLVRKAYESKEIDFDNQSNMQQHESITYLEKLRSLRKTLIYEKNKILGYASVN